MSAGRIDDAAGWNGRLLSGGVGEATRWAAWCLYWFGAGLSMTGLWVIAHECQFRFPFFHFESSSSLSKRRFSPPTSSHELRELIHCRAGGHQAFSTSKTLNNAVGFVIHSLLLVPYHSWRISHSKHHAATGHMTRDEVFIPRTRSQAVKAKANRKIVNVGGIDMEELLEDAPIYRLGHLLVQQVLSSLLPRPNLIIDTNSLLHSFLVGQPISSTTSLDEPHTLPGPIVRHLAPLPSQFVF